MTEEQIKFITPILSTFENDDIRNFAEELLNNLPPYIWEVGASSTGKYHPAYTLGSYGLMKHQVAVCRFINFFFELDQYKNRYTSRQRDLLRLAGLIHDGRKSGEQSDYEKSKYTKFDHPLLMGKVILSYKDKRFLDTEELKYIAKAIVTHMGQFNTDKRSPGVVLPIPSDEPSELVHLADYLASRKCLDMNFDDYIIPINIPEPSDYTLTFGKHSGKKLTEVPKDYLAWLSHQDLKDPLKTLVDNILHPASKEVETLPSEDSEELPFK